MHMTLHYANICMYLHIIHPISGKCNPHIEYFPGIIFQSKEIFYVFVGDSKPRLSEEQVLHLAPRVYVTLERGLGRWERCGTRFSERLFARFPKKRGRWFSFFVFVPLS